MKKLLIFSTLFLSAIAFADNEIECFNHSATYTFHEKDDGYYFMRVASVDNKVEFGPFASEAEASAEAVKNCEQYSLALDGPLSEMAPPSKVSIPSEDLPLSE